MNDEEKLFLIVLGAVLLAFLIEDLIRPAVGDFIYWLPPSGFSNRPPNPPGAPPVVSCYPGGNFPPQA